MATEKKIKTSAGMETASQTVARAKSMLAQTKAEGSKPYKGSSYEKEFQKNYPVITPNQMTPVEKPQVPEPVADTTDYWSMLTQGNAALAGTGMQYDAQTSQLTPQNTQDPILAALLNLQNTTAQTPDLGAVEKQSWKDAGVDRAQRDFNSVSSQINAITTGAQQQIQGLEGQGRGITTDILDNQAWEIQRRATIAALPLQAQLAAAQGNLELARERYNMLFQIRSQDAQAKYQAKVNMANTLLQYADRQDQKRLELYKMDRQENLQKEMAQIGFEHQKALMALEQSYKTTSDPKIETQLIGDTLYERDATTGQWKAVAGGSTSGQSPANLDAKYTSLLNDIGKARTLSGAVGAGWLERNVKNAVSGNNEPAQLQNIVDTIKANLLTLNTDPNIKKFFGPQMSNRDVELMMGAAGTLNPITQNEEEFLKDLTDASDLIVRARTAVSQGSGNLNSAQTVTNYDALTPEGFPVIFID